MNYLVSAISYENQRKKDNKDQDEKSPSIYAFAGYMENQEEEKESKWKSMGIEPILYKIKEENDHSLLYKTIKKWADLKREGLTGKKHFLEDRVKHTYRDSDKKVGQSVSSLLKSDKNLSKFFSERYPPFNISWLKPLSENGLLDKFVKCPSQGFIFEKIPLWEPLPQSKFIVDWFFKHLDKKELIHWVIDNHCFLHPLLKLCLRREIENKNKQTNKQLLKLDEEKLLFWKNVSSINYNPQKIDSVIITVLIEELNKKYSFIKVHELLQCLEPYIAFEKYSDAERRYYQKSYPDFKDNLEPKIYETKLKARYDDWPNKIPNEKILLRHAEDFMDLLKRAMEKALDFKMIKDHRDPFHIARPSIADHRKNQNFDSWTYIINLARDSFDLAMREDKPLAGLLLEKWKLYPYPLFYRLILYAVTKHSHLDENTAIDLLKDQTNHVLWSQCCRRETLEYLRKRKHLEKGFKTLLNSIMQGPSRSLFRKNFSDNEIERYKNLSIYHKLNCLKEVNVDFPEKIEKYYNEIQKQYPSETKKIKYEFNDFPFYIETFWEGEHSTLYNELNAKEIYNSIKDGNPNDYLESQLNEIRKGNKKDNFRELVKALPEKAFEVLLMFSDENENKDFFWKIFLEEIPFAKKETQDDFLLKILEELKKFDDSLIEKCLRPFTFVFKRSFCVYLYSKDKQTFINLWESLWKAALKDSQTIYDDPSSGALNNPLGVLSECVFLILWHQFQKIQKNEKIPEEMKNYFKNIIEAGKEKDSSVFFHFGIYLYDLWHLDREWVVENIKPLMDWNKNKTICQSLWEGCSNNPGLGSDFLSDFKDTFYQLFLNKEIFTDKNELIPELLFITTGGKWEINIFEKEDEINKLKAIIDNSILKSISAKILYLLKNSEDKSATLWLEKIKPWIEKFWPHQNNMKSNEIACNLSLAILYCGDQMPSAFQLLRDKIEEFIKEPSFWFPHQDILEDRLPHVFNYPEQLVSLLDWNCSGMETSSDLAIGYFKKDVKKVLEKIKEKNPEIEKYELYKNLYERL